MILNQSTGSSSLPLAHSPLHTKVTRRVTPCRQTNNLIPDDVISLWSECCSTSILVWTQAVSYDPREIHPNPRWSRFSGNIRALPLPFSTQIRNCAVPHTFVQPIDCVMPNPRPGDTNRVSRTSEWTEGVATPTLCRLVPMPGCLLGMNLQPAPAHRRPAENLPLPPLLRQDANLRPDRKPHLWKPSSTWDPANPHPSCNWLTSAWARSHQRQLNSVHACASQPSPTCRRGNISIRPSAHSKQTCRTTSSRHSTNTTCTKQTTRQRACTCKSG